MIVLPQIKRRGGGGEEGLALSPHRVMTAANSAQDRAHTEREKPNQLLFPHKLCEPASLDGRSAELIHYIKKKPPEVLSRHRALLCQ